jgi:general secretion pathway protein K
MSAISGERDDSGAQRGMVLVIVLWIVALLAVMAGGFAYSMRVETRLATSAVERAQARALAEAGVAYAQAWQLDHEASRKIWPPNGDPHEWSFGGGRLRIQVTDANGLVNLNNADPKLLETLFAGVGLEGRDRDRLVQAILDWRESDQGSACRWVRAAPSGVRAADSGRRKPALRASRNCSKSRESPRKFTSESPTRSPCFRTMLA